MTKSKPKPTLSPKPKKTSTDPMVIAVLKAYREREAFFAWLEARDFAPVKSDRGVHVQPELQHEFNSLLNELAETPEAMRGFGLTSLRFEPAPEPSRLRGRRG
jgi:hypothetical protein